MPEDPKPDPKPDDKTFTQADVNRIVEDRLKREKTNHADYEDLKAKAAKLDQLEADAKTAEQRAAEAQATADKRIADVEAKVAEAEARALRAEVATAKGLSSTQAKRLQGATREELEADADELLEAFPTTTSTKSPPSAKPKPDLKGGSDPSEEPSETDPAKLAESVPRY